MGAGITGLVCAHSLQRQGENVTLLEASAHPGGWCQTEHHADGYTECGPRTFSAARTPELLQLVHALGLSKDLRWAPKEAQKRFLWDGSHMLPVPPSLRQMLAIPLFRQLIKELVQEGFRPRQNCLHESLQQLLLRRFGPAAVALSVPIVQGIWAADPCLLDAAACLGSLVRAEQEHGGIVRSVMCSLYHRIWKRGPSASHQKPQGLWTLQQGMGQLIDTLVQQAQGSLKLNHRAVRVDMKQGGWRLHTTDERGSKHSWQGSHLWMCLPNPALRGIEGPWTLPPSLSMGSLRVIDCIWNRSDVLPLGFGYLCLTPQKEPLLGAVYDSACFPHQTPGCSKATLMQGGALQQQWLQHPSAIEEAVHGFCRHTGLPQPDRVQGRLADQAIAQYHVGIQEQMLDWQQELQQLPPVQFLGASWGGVAVEDCVRSALTQSKAAGGYARSVVVPGYIQKTSSDGVQDRVARDDTDTACSLPERNRKPC